MRYVSADVIITCLFVLAASVGCDETEKAGRNGESNTSAGKLVVVLLDRSGSTQKDRPLYAKALSSIRASLIDGDRFVMGPITSASGTDFATSIDYKLPLSIKDQGWLDEPIKYKREKEEGERIRNQLLADLDQDIQSMLGKDSKAARTTIFESLRVVEPLFQVEERKKILVLLSDMIEDSGAVNFSRGNLSDSGVIQVIEHQRKTKTLPDLSSVEVYVVGALASPPEKAAAVENFWMKYFDSTGANIQKGHYSRVLISFNE